MDIDLSQVKELLSSRSDLIRHRHVFILSGDTVWQKKCLKDILSGYENTALWVGEDDPVDYPFIQVKKTAAWLGKEKQVVIFDANKNFNPDSFSAISGIVVGGGLFFLLLPKKERWNDVYASPFGQRLVHSISQYPELIVINQDDHYLNFTENFKKKDVVENYNAPFLTLDQQRSVETIQKYISENSQLPIVLVSDRGRGKSATLGIAAARLLELGVKNIIITAPRLSAADVIFKHIAENISNAVVIRGCIKVGEATVQFYSPDQLLQKNIEADILLVDEAAAIPVPVLTSFLYKYSQCIFATTVHGYEGTGRGFTLRFYKELDKKNKNWLRLEMKTPIRWAENDPLEKWMFDFLCLNAEIIEIKQLGGISLEKIKYQLINKNELYENEELLTEVFSLLVIAHYRTRPKDLKSMLDDEDISVYVSLYNEHIIAVALVIREGSFSSLLSTEVYRGQRRPQGNLLAQTLTYHCGEEDAATLDYARVMRIAVHPELQEKKIGTELLRFIITSEKKNGRDAIGSSFGLNERLLNFWYRLDFSLVRIGFTREQSSGEHASIMLLALTSAGRKVSQAVVERFSGQIGFLLNDVLKDLTENLKNDFILQSKETFELTYFDKTDLHSFIEYSRNYELCIASITKLVNLKISLIQDKTFPNNFRIILNKKIIDKLSWNEVVSTMKLIGKREARMLLHQAVIYLNKITSPVFKTRQ